MTNLPVTQREAPEAPVGLEDFDDSSAPIPRLNIDGPRALFVDSLSGEEYETLNTVVLGLVRQRVLWTPGDLKEGAKPLCRSRDGKIGLPQEGFPWEESGFEKFDLDDEQQELSCDACPLKEWGSDPQSGEKPWCTEQAITIVYHEGGPALVTLQRSSMAAIRAYAASFKRSGKPMFTKYATVSLLPQRRGSVRYAVPEFKSAGTTPEEDHDFFADMFIKARTFLTSRRTAVVADDTDTDNTIASAAVRPRREPIAVPDDEEPF
jgi:hypothetical protein